MLGSGTNADDVADRAATGRERFGAHGVHVVHLKRDVSPSGTTRRRQGPVDRRLVAEDLEGRTVVAEAG